MHHRHTKLRFAGLALLLSSVACSGCRPAPDVPSPTSTTAPVAPQRIITLAPNAAEIIAELGAADRIVAVSEFCVHPDLKALPNIGGLFNPNLEAILRLRPDMIVLRGHSDTLERLCRDKQIRVYQDPTEDLDDIYTAIRELGRLLDQTNEADALERDMRHRLDRIAATVAGKSRPRVFVTIARKPDSLAGILTAGRGTFVDELITHAGGRNIFAHTAVDYPQVSPEAILAARPDVIIEAMPEENPSPELDDRVRGLWRDLGPTPATRDGRIYVLTVDHALIPSPRIVEVVAEIARLLHPEADID